MSSIIMRVQPEDVSSKMLKDAHPGTHLKDMLDNTCLTVFNLTYRLKLSSSVLNDFISRKTDITGELALKLGKFFGTTPEYWMNLQKDHDLLVGIKNMRDNGYSMIEPLKKEEVIESEVEDERTNYNRSNMKGYAGEYDWNVTSPINSINKENTEDKQNDAKSLINSETKDNLAHCEAEFGVYDPMKIQTLLRVIRFGIIRGNKALVIGTSGKVITLQELLPNPDKALIDPKSATAHLITTLYIHEIHAKDLA